MSTAPRDDPRGALQAARDAFERRDWPRAHDLFTALREESGLGADDLASLASCAWWMGRSDESMSVGEESYRHYLRDEQLQAAAIAAVGVAIEHFLRGDDALGTGWISRAQRALDGQPEGPAHGVLLFLTKVESALGGIGPGNRDSLDALVASARQVQEIGRRHGDPNLVTCGMMGEGRALVKCGRTPEGLALLDEALIAVLSDELSPEWAGNVYCHSVGVGDRGAPGEASLPTWTDDPRGDRHEPASEESRRDVRAVLRACPVQPLGRGADRARSASPG